MRPTFQAATLALFFIWSAEATPYGTGPLQALTPKDLASRATICNGHAELCDRSFGNVTFVGAHDSYSIGAVNINGTSSSLAANQDQNLTQQLNDGIRMLQVQTHNQSGVIELCHTSCSLLDGGSLETYLKTVKSWMDGNPTEVLSILIVNGDNIPISQFGSIFEAAGLAGLSFVPSTLPLTPSQWPTMGSMIDANTRLVTFMDNGADPNQVPYIIDEFTNVFETAFDVVGSFDCAVNRSHGDTNPASHMYLINHFENVEVLLGITQPDIANAATTNGLTGQNSLGDQVSLCTQTYNVAPNFMLVDFYEFGNGSVFEMAAQLNGVTYAPTTPIAVPGSSSASVSSMPANGGSIALQQWSLLQYLTYIVCTTLGSTFLF